MDEGKNNSFEFEGKTVDEAINKGLKKLNLTKDDVEIKILDEGTTGLFGLMGNKPAKVKIEKKQGKKLHIKNSFKDDKIYNEIEKLLREETEKIMKLMNFKNIKIDISPGETENEIKLDINSNSDRDISILIGKNGRTISALELLLQTIINHKILDKHQIKENVRPKLSLDINRYYARKIEKIKEQVNKAIETVKKTGKSQKLEPMPSKIRKYIHTMLKDNIHVESTSEGEGTERKIVIKPKNKK